MGVGASKKTELLIVGDLHETGEDAIREVAEVAVKENLTVLNLGDYIDRRGKDDNKKLAERIRKQLEIFDNRRKSIIIHGNHEPRRAYTLALKDFKNVIDNHNNITELDQYSIVGFGGSHTPEPEKKHSGSYYKDESMAKQVRTLLNKACEPYEEQYAILQLHEPAKGYLDRVPSGYRIGNGKFRDLINETNPGFVLSGHVHESPGAHIRVRRKRKRKEDDGFNVDLRRYLRYWDGTSSRAKYPTYSFVPKDGETGEHPVDYKKHFGPIPNIKITDAGLKRGGKDRHIDNSKNVTLTYNMDEYDLTYFLNPGALCDNKREPFAGRYAVLKLSEEQKPDGKYRTIELEMRNIKAKTLS